MKIKRMLRDNDGVSPVIGIILVVTITVTLAAVVASFVLGVGANQQTTPAVSFTFDYTQGNDDASSYLKITHDGGDAIPGNQIYLRGSNFANKDFQADSSVSISDSKVVYQSSSPGSTWKSVGGDMSTLKGDNSAISAGDSLITQADSDYEIRVIWQPSNADTSATLGQDTGPVG